MNEYHSQVRVLNRLIKIIFPPGKRGGESSRVAFLEVPRALHSEHLVGKPTHGTTTNIEIFLLTKSQID